MEAIKRILFSGWHFMRWLRLAFGIFFIIQAIQMHQSLMGAVGVFFLLTAITNTGCCGPASCATPIRKDNRKKPEEINFEEIKTD